MRPRNSTNLESPDHQKNYAKCSSLHTCSSCRYMFSLELFTQTILAILTHFFTYLPGCKRKNLTLILAEEVSEINSPGRLLYNSHQTKEKQSDFPGLKKAGRFHCQQYHAIEFIPNLQYPVRHHPVPMSNQGLLFWK